MLNKIFASFAKAADFFAGLTGWRRFLTAAVLGVFASYAMPPWGWLAAFAFAIILFMWLLNGAEKLLSAIGIGFCFGFGLFAWGLLWVNNALLLYAQSLAFLALPFTVGIGIWGGIFIAIAAGVAYLLPQGISRILAFAAMWALMEWVRSWFLTGFPWNLTASVWEKSDATLQIISVIGPYGLGLLTITLFASWSLISKPNKKSAVFIGFFLILFTAISGFGEWRLNQASDDTVKDVKIRIVQPSVPQKLKWEKERAEKNLAAYLDLSTKYLDGITHIIWGETASPYPLFQDAYTRMEIARKLPDDVVLITGVVRAEGNKKDNLRLYNSAMVMTGKGSIAGGYDKSHLVPFGEYVPFRSLLPWDKITPGQTDFSSGNGAETIVIPNAPPAGISICYEIIFPSAVVDKTNRPAWLINLTNDGWYGISSGPYQHFFAARMRAIEEGIPVIRAANSGISGVINAYGQVLGLLPLNAKQVLDAKIPAETIYPLYARYGNTISFILISFWLALSLILALRSKS